MNTFGPVVYLAAICVYLVLRTQSAAQRRDIALEYVRLGVPVPPPRPRVEMLEAILTATIGLMVTLFAGGAAYSNLMTLRMVNQFTRDGRNGAQDIPAMLHAQWLWLAVTFGGGIVLIVLGVRAIRENMPRPSPGAGSAQPDLFSPRQ